MLRRWFEAICREDDGQSLIEYTLLLAFLALASAGVFMQVGGSSAEVWSGAQTTIAGAADTASGTTPASAPPSGSGSTGGSSSGSGGHGGHGGHDGRH